MTRLLSALLLVVAFAAPAAASDWFGDILGPYTGPVLNGSGIQQMQTEFFIDAAGHLAGRYHVQDSVPFDGTLDGFREEAPFVGSFVWHDRYGAGVVHLVFDPDRGRFTGRWGGTGPVEGNVFDGRRETGPRVGS